MLRYLGYELIDSNYEGEYHFEDWRKVGSEAPHIIAIGTADRPLGSEPLNRRAVGRFSHLAFAATDRADVDRFYAEVLVPLERQGLCTVEDPPCACPEYRPDYYATFFFDPDGIKFEFVV